MFGYAQKCFSCELGFVIPDESAETAGDWDSSSTYVTVDIECPKCGTLVLKRGEAINPDDRVSYDENEPVSR